MTYQPRLELPTEFALAAACCRWAASGEGAENISALSEAANWHQFLATCRRHRVQGLAWHTLSSLNQVPPEPIRIALAGDAQSVAEQGLRAARESSRLADAFEKAGLPLVFLKGLTVGQLAYDNAFIKAGWDIDLLIAPQDVQPAARLLETHAYHVHVPSRRDKLLRWHGLSKESVWREPGGLVVELHSRLADQPQLLGGIGVRSPTQTVPIAPGIALRTLAHRELFAYLCVHGASSAWFRLKWISDLFGLLTRHNLEEIGRAFRSSQKLGAERSAAQALLLANWLFDLPLPIEAETEISTPANRWLAKVALRTMIGKEPTERPFGTVPIHATQFVLKSGARYKVAELLRQLRVAVSRP